MTEQITLAAGCFWCLEAIFKRLKGVHKVTPGYANGEGLPTYELVSGGRSGFAEAVQVEFDPQLVSVNDLLEVFFDLHDPTTLNRQGHDIGPQYRSAVFYQNDEQKQAAEIHKNKLSNRYNSPIVTAIEPLRNFYPAEAYHLNYYEKNPNQAYCRLVIDPKITKLFKTHQNLIK